MDLITSKEDLRRSLIKLKLEQNHIRYAGKTTTENKNFKFYNYRYIDEDLHISHEFGWKADNAEYSDNLGELVLNTMLDFRNLYK